MTMKRILTALVCVVACVLCAFIAWHVRGVDIAKANKVCNEVGPDVLKREEAKIVTTSGDAITARLYVYGSNFMQCTIERTNGHSVAVLELINTAEGYQVKRLSIASGPGKGKIVLDASFHTNGAAQYLCVRQGLHPLRSQWFSEQTELLYDESASIADPSKRTRQCFGPGGVVTSVVKSVVNLICVD
jgi:hypothetical protein